MTRKRTFLAMLKDRLYQGKKFSTKRFRDSSQLISVSESMKDFCKAFDFPFLLRNLQYDFNNWKEPLIISFVNLFLR